MLKELRSRRFGQAQYAVAILLTLAAFDSKPASAGVIAYVYQSGSDVKADLSGSFSSLVGVQNTSLSFPGSLISGGEIDPINGSENHLKFGPSGTHSIKTYPFDKTSGPTLGWGTSPNYSASFPATNYVLNGLGTNGHFSFSDIGFIKDIKISASYINGTPITATATWANKTMASLFLDNPGTFVYTNQGGSETFTMVIGSAPPGGGGAAVPEPSSLAIASVLGLIGWRRARRKRTQASS
jgi:hypothetical protein